jgi:hypothetical protein
LFIPIANVGAYGPDSHWYDSTSGDMFVYVRLLFGSGIPLSDVNIALFVSWNVCSDGTVVFSLTCVVSEFLMFAKYIHAPNPITIPSAIKPRQK